MSARIPRGNYKSYTVEQKKAAVELAMRHTNTYASQQLKISESTIRTWKKKFQAGELGVNLYTGRQITYSTEIDLQIRDWVLHQRESSLPITRTDLSEYARRAVNRPDFSATDGWRRQFLKRHNFSFRTRTSVAQRLPEDLQRRVDLFYRHLKEVRFDEEFEVIVNMDETAVFFDLVPSKTIAERGKKAVIIRSTGAEKRHLTVVLAISSTGEALDPLVIFKGKRWPSDLHQVPDGVHVKLQEKGWMTEDLMLHWIETVLVPHTRGRHCLLVMDSFAGHTTPAVRDRLSKVNVTPAIIPGGCTSTLQPLDVSINKPFKAHIRESWMEYMRTAEPVGGGTPTADRQRVVEWVHNSWTTIANQPAMITRSFEATGISTALNDAEADLQRQEESLKLALESDDDSQDFLGFSPEAVPNFEHYTDQHDPFLEFDRDTCSAL